MQPTPEQTPSPYWGPPESPSPRWCLFPIMLSSNLCWVNPHYQFKTFPLRPQVFARWPIPSLRTVAPRLPEPPIVSLCHQGRSIGSEGPGRSSWAGLGGYLQTSFVAWYSACYSKKVDRLSFCWTPGWHMSGPFHLLRGPSFSHDH